jgi:hypothetical protein
MHQLFGRMMRESQKLDELVVRAIQRIGGPSLRHLTSTPLTLPLQRLGGSKSLRSPTISQE